MKAPIMFIMIVVCILCTAQLEREVDKQQRKNNLRKSRKYWASPKDQGDETSPKSKDAAKLSSNRPPPLPWALTSSSEPSPQQAVHGGCSEHSGPPRAGRTWQAPSGCWALLCFNQRGLPQPGSWAKAGKQNVPAMLGIQRDKELFFWEEIFFPLCLGEALSHPPCPLIISWAWGLVDYPGAHAYLFRGGEWKTA